MEFIIGIVSTIWFGFLTWFILVPITLAIISGVVVFAVVILMLLYERFENRFKRRF